MIPEILMVLQNKSGILKYQGLKWTSGSLGFVMKLRVSEAWKIL